MTQLSDWLRGPDRRPPLADLANLALANNSEQGGGDEKSQTHSGTVAGANVAKADGDEAIERLLRRLAEDKRPEHQEAIAGLRALTVALLKGQTIAEESLAEAVRLALLIDPRQSRGETIQSVHPLDVELTGAELVKAVMLAIPQAHDRRRTGVG